MGISAADVNQLRQTTGAGMMDCKKALMEANGDFEEAIVILRKKGQKVSASRSDRDAKEGAIIAKVSADCKMGVIVELNCETDFVAKNDDFMSFANAITDAAIANKVADIESLKALDFGGMTLADKITEYIGKIGEKIDIRNYVVIHGEYIVPYIHQGNKLGVLVEFNQNNDLVLAAGKDVAMQIAAMNPVAVDKDDVDPTIVEREIEIGKDQARQEGKPEAILEKIALGKLNKFYQDSTLLNQAFVKDGSVTITQMLDKVSKGLTVKQFKRITLGS